MCLFIDDDDGYDDDDDGVGVVLNVVETVYQRES